MTAADWFLPALSVAGVGVWVANLRHSLRRITAERMAPDGVRLMTVATIAIIAVALSWSSLLYPDLIGVEASRWGITTARMALLIGGVVVWWMGHREDTARG